MATGVVGVIGLAVLAVAVLAAVEPGLLGGAVTQFDRLEAVGARLLIGVVGGGLTTLAWRFAGSGGRVETDERLDAIRSTPPEEVTVDPLTITGGGIDRAYQDAVETGEPQAAVEPLRDRAVAVERAVSGVDEQTARRRVADGEWTDDDLAASVVGSEVTIPVVARLRAWLDPTAEADRRLSRVVAAIEDRLEET